MEKIYEILNGWHEFLVDPDRLIYAAAALLLTSALGLALGPVAGNANPVLWQGIDLIFGRIGDKLDRAGRPQADLIFRGFLITFFALILTFLLARTVHNWSMGSNYSPAIEILALSLTLTSGTVWYGLNRLYKAMGQKKVQKGAYYTLARSARVNLTGSDDFSITRSAIGFSARAFDKGLVAPVIWYIIFGLQGAFIYAVLAALAWRFGKNGLNRGFGAIPLMLEELLGYIPSIFSALIITLAGFFTPTGKLHKGIASWFGHRGRAFYAQGGMPLSALAWTLNLALGGPIQSIDGENQKLAWIGPKKATAKVDPAHLRRSIVISVTAHLLFLCMLLVVYIYGVRIFSTNA